MTAETNRGLVLDEQSRSGHVVITMSGVLGATTYRTARDSIVKAALDGPTSVIVEVNDLDVPVASAWSVFTSARWQVSQWPDVPVRLVAADPARRELLRRQGLTRYVAVYGTVAEAISLPVSAQPRRRARTALTGSAASIQHAQEFVAMALTQWQCEEMIPAATVVVTELVDNVLRHTDGPPRIRLETYRDTVTVAVEDDSTDRAGLREATSMLTNGLRIVEAVSRVWGNSPTQTGKVVWAVLDANHRI
jgi:hypothetical protein